MASLVEIFEKSCKGNLVNMKRLLRDSNIERNDDLGFEVYKFADDSTIMFGNSGGHDLYTISHKVN